MASVIPISGTISMDHIRREIGDTNAVSISDSSVLNLVGKSSNISFSDFYGQSIHASFTFEVGQKTIAGGQHMVFKGFNKGEIGSKISSSKCDISKITTNSLSPHVLEVNFTRFSGNMTSGYRFIMLTNKGQTLYTNFLRIQVNTPMVFDCRDIFRAFDCYDVWCRIES